MNKPTNSHSQRERILAALKTGRRIPMPELSRIGSGKEHGHVACFGTRLHELRHDFGYDIRKVKDERVDGQRQTEYQLFRGETPWTDVRWPDKSENPAPKPPEYDAIGQARLFA